MDNLWDIRKNYDDLIPDRIKQANEMSDARLQAQKEMWLENRKILNDAINDASSGLGEESKAAFKDMSDLYRARQNIISKSKIDIKGKPGALSPKEILKKAVKPVLGGVLGYKILVD